MSSRDMNHAGLNVGATDHATHAEAEYSLFGFWIFLMSDALVFALLFAIYATLQHASAGRSAVSPSRPWCCWPAASPTAWRRWR